MAELIKKSEHQTISIAVTGTTSSGKSTVVNLLCGHEIMPVSAGEMTRALLPFITILKNGYSGCLKRPMQCGSAGNGII